MLTRSGIFNEGCRHARRCRGSGKCLLLVESFMLIVHSSQEYDEEYLEDAEESVSLLFVHGASNSSMMQDYEEVWPEDASESAISPIAHSLVSV